MPAPQRKSLELFQELAALAHSGPLPPLFVARVKREAQAMMGVDAVGGYMLRGALASVLGDVAAMHEDHERSINAAPNDPMVLRNYSCSLRWVGLIYEAHAYAVKAAKILPNDYLMLNSLVSSAVDLGRIFEAQRLLAKLLELSRCMELPPSEQEKLEILNWMVAGVCEGASKRGITDEMLAPLVETAFGVLKESKVEPPFTVDALPSQGRYPERGIEFLIRLKKAGGETAGDLNLDLAGKLAEQNVPANVADFMSLVFIGTEANDVRFEQRSAVAG